MADVSSGVRLRNHKTQAFSERTADAVFIAIGHEPNTELFAGQLDLDQKGYIASSDGVHTAVEGVFVAGDVYDARYRQAVTAAGMGCRAAIEAERYLESEHAREALFTPALDTVRTRVRTQALNGIGATGRFYYEKDGALEKVRRAPIRLVRPKSGPV